MNTRATATLFAAVLAFGAVVQVFLPLKARAQDHSPHHADFYRHWMQPGVHPPISCCNARKVEGGVETGDCEPTKARIVNGNWQAWLRQESRWIDIPDSKVIRERNPAAKRRWRASGSGRHGKLNGNGQVPTRLLPLKPICKRP